MNLILLSGGSGKRLWPLSNDIRSKQFIKLFRGINNSYESMVQRVFRQIMTVDPEASVTVATSKSQVSAIRNQLGQKVSLCVEPCRRDTFPAIVLATMYLHDVLNVSEEVSVAVCPVDPFVENTYYEAVQSLIKLSNESSTNLALMGVEPTYPSEKYGYIIPENRENISPVLEFKEKPYKIDAKKYISQGALWNAGVFAFKLKYMIEKAHEIIDFRGYDDLVKKYATLEKISFDYAVVEKEKSIQVMRYNGEWKDVGTWNTMTEVMTDEVKGNVTCDSECENLHAVNELDIPILCMGCKNMVIAASCDGILVSDKERSGYIKPYVEQINSETKFAEKSWGTYTVLDVQPEAMTVKIMLDTNHQMSYHSHELRDENWNVVDGEGFVILDGKKISVSKGSLINIPKGTMHTIIAQTQMIVIEVQVGKISREDKQIFNA